MPPPLAALATVALLRVPRALSRAPPAGCRRASRRRARCARCLLDSGRVDAVRVAARLDLHRLSRGSRSATRRSAGRCRATRRSAASIGVSFLDAVARRQLVLLALAAGALVAGRCSASWRSVARRSAAPRRVDRRRGRAGRASRCCRATSPQELKFRPERYARDRSRPTRGSPRRRDARLIVLPETAVPRFLDRVDPAYLAAARRGRAQQRRRPAARRAATAPPTATTYNSVHQPRRSPRAGLPQGAPGAVRRVRAAGLRLDRCACCRHPDVGLLARRGRPAAARGRRPARRGQHLLRGRVRRRDRARSCREATLLVNVSNVAWFGDSLAPGQHLQIARMRAIETGRMHLAATNTGITAAIDRDGARARAACRSSPKAGSRCAAQGYAGATPYARFADWPAASRCSRSAASLLVAWRACSR